MEDQMKAGLIPKVPQLDETEGPSEAMGNSWPALQPQDDYQLPDLKIDKQSQSKSGIDTDVQLVGKTP